MRSASSFTFGIFCSVAVIALACGGGGGGGKHGDGGTGGSSAGVGGTGGADGGAAGSSGGTDVGGTGGTEGGAGGTTGGNGGAAGAGGSGGASLTLFADPAAPGADAQCALVDGELVCPVDAEAQLTPVARNENGRVIRLADWSVLWFTSNDEVGLQQDFDNIATVVADLDWFTLSREPKTTVTASYENLQALLPVVVALNAAGEWRCRTDSLLSTTLSLTQLGRTVTDDASGYAGTVFNNTLVVGSSAFDISATFTSRTQLSGTYAGGGLSGDITCTKL